MHIDLIGLGNSGKGAVADFLSEFNCIKSMSNDFEFNLIRVPGGLFDLNLYMNERFTAIYSDDAIRRFRKVTIRLGSRTGFYGLQEIKNSAGFSYENFFPGFKNLTNDLIKNLVIYEYKGLWPYTLLSDNTLNLIWKRIRNKFIPLLSNDNILYAYNHEASGLIKNYFYEILKLGIGKDDHQYFLTNNAFELTLLDSQLNLFDNSKCIIVVRDPRDTYINIVKGNRNMSSLYSKLNPYGFNLNCVNDIDNYIFNQRLLLQKLKTVNTDKCLIVDFNEFVLNYDTVREKICVFLGIALDSHSRPMSKFKPGVSAKNINFYKEFYKEKEVVKLQSQLKDLWNFNPF
jgi:hypothetical protein